MPKPTRLTKTVRKMTISGRDTCCDYASLCQCGRPIERARKAIERNRERRPLPAISGRVDGERGALPQESNRRRIECHRHQAAHGDAGPVAQRRSGRSLVDLKSHRPVKRESKRKHERAFRPVRRWRDQLDRQEKLTRLLFGLALRQGAELPAVLWHTCDFPVAIYFLKRGPAWRNWRRRCSLRRRKRRDRRQKTNDDDRLHSNPSENWNAWRVWARAPLHS